MKIRGWVLGFLATIGVAGGAICDSGGPGAEVSHRRYQSRPPGYLTNLPFDPQTNTVEKAQDSIPGFSPSRSRIGKYAKLAVDRTVHVSDDGKWYFGDAMVSRRRRRSAPTRTRLAGGQVSNLTTPGRRPP
jgi:hypothetical protein